MAVLVQVMVDPVAAGVAFTAHPVTGDRDQIVVTAVAGLGDRLVSGEAVGEEWTITRHAATLTRPVRKDLRVLTAGQAQAVADLARRVAERYGRPQDIEWAIDHDRHAVAAAGPADDRRARPGVLDCARPGVVDAQLPARRVAARGRHAAVRHVAAAGAGGWLPRRHARHRRSPGAVPVCAGQRLVLQRPSDPVTKAVGASAVARTRLTR